MKHMYQKIKLKHKRNGKIDLIKSFPISKVFFFFFKKISSQISLLINRAIHLKDTIKQCGGNLTDNTLL